MLSPKRLICAHDFHMAHLVPSHPYILVNRSLLCNCHLQPGLTYLLKSLSSCEPSQPFKMFFSVNLAFQHYMSKFGLRHSPMVGDELLSKEHIFDMFLNDTAHPVLLPNKSIPMLPLDPPNILVELFQSFANQWSITPNLPFFPLLRHIPDEKPRKGSFLSSTTTHIIYMDTGRVLLCILLP